MWRLATLDEHAYSRKFIADVVDSFESAQPFANGDLTRGEPS